MFDTNKIALCYPNYADRQDCTLSGGDWLSSLPLSNLKNRVLQKRARSKDTLPTSTKFDITLLSPQPVLCLTLAGHNLSVNARVKVVVYDDVLKNNIYYDSGWVDAWPQIFESDSLEWESDNFWLGTLSNDQRVDFTPLFVDLFSKATFVPVAKYITVEIDDTTNPDGYVEIGRLFFSDVWQPTRNASLGLSFKHNTTTEIETTLSDTEYFDVHRPRRSVSFNLDRIPLSDAFGRVFSLQRALGVHGEVLFAYTTEDVLYSYERRFLGRLQELDAISEPYVDRRHQVPVNIIEIV